MRARRRAAVALLVLVPLACAGGDHLPRLRTALHHEPARLVHPDGAFIVGTAKGECGFPRPTELALLDERDGSERWSQPIPWSPDAPVVLGDRVVAVARTVDGNPPSVTAMDLRTGRPRWQRFLAHEVVEAVAALPGMVIVGTGSDERYLLLDASGAVTALAGAEGRAAVAAEASGPFVAFRRPGDVRLYDVASGEVRPAGQVSTTTGVQSVQVKPTGEVVSEGAGRSWRSSPVGRADRLQPVRVAADGSTVVVLLGAVTGPNHRLAVLDAVTGEVRWSLDGVRDAAPAGALVVYDVRGATAPDAPTRTVHVVDAVTGAERSSTTSAVPLGAYVGTTARGGLVFAETDLARLRVAVVPDVAHAPVELTAEGRSSGPQIVSALTDSLILVSWRSTLHAFALDGTPRWQASGEWEVRWIVATPAGILVSRGAGDYGCE